MARSVRTVERMAFTAAATAILIAFILPGCSQSQDNSPISISNSQGRALSVACSTDGAVAYVTDGRNIYRYERRPASPAAWECILSQDERLELAVKHDPREQQSPPTGQDKPAEQKPESKPVGKN